MPRKLVGGLIQTAAPLVDPSVPIDKIRKTAIDAHIPLIEAAGLSQDACWYDAAEAVPGSRGNFLAVESDENDELVVAETCGSMAEQFA